MALNLLYSYTRSNTPNPSTLIEVYWDNVAVGFFVNENGSAIFSGPADGVAGQIIPYYFCSGTTLSRFLGQAAYPYAQKIEDLNSPSCTVPDYNLGVTIPVTTTVASGPYSPDGTATISYYGTVSAPGNVRYSLNNTTWFSTNFFTGLAPGQYTIYIRDEDPALTASQWHKAQANFVIAAGEVTYGKRYTLPFKSQSQAPVNYALDIFKKYFTGSVAAVCGNDSPVILEYSDDGKDKYEVFKGSKCNITLISDTRMQFVDFFSSDEREHRVDVLREGVLFWRGFILPEIYNEPFISARYYVSLTAADGLGTLKNYTYADVNGNAFAGERSIINIVFDCLDRLESGLPVMSIVDVYEAGMREATLTTDVDPIISDPLFQAKVNTDNFRDSKGKLMDCEKVLKMVLVSFGARVYQSGGKWVIESIDAKRVSCWAVTYNPNRSFASYQILNPVVDTALPNTGGLQWVNGDQQLEILPAYKRTLVRAELVKANTNIPDGDFSENAWSGSTLKQFKTTAPIQKVVVSEKEDKNAVKLTNGVTAIGTAKFIQSALFNLVADATEKLLLKIKFKVEKNGVDSFTPQIYFQLSGGGFTFTNNVWTATASNVYYTFKSEQINTLVTHEIVIPAIPGTADYTFTIYEVVNAFNLELHSLELSPLPAGLKPLEVVESEITNTRAYSFIPEEKEIYFVDTQVTTNFKRVHKNYISVNGLQSKSWHFKGQTGNNSLINILSSNIAYNHSRPSHVIRGALKGDISFFNTIREQYDSGRLFMWDALNIDFKRGQYSGTLIELVNPTTEEVLYVDAGYVDAGYVL